MGKIEKDIIEQRILDAIEEAGLDPNETPQPGSNEEEIIYDIKYKAVKQLKRELVQADEYLWIHYEQFYETSKDDVFNRSWINNNKGIQGTIKKYSLLIPILTYVFNMNRRNLKSEDMEHMKKISNGKTHTSKTGQEWKLSCFIADKKFYNEVAESLGCAAITVQKFVRSLVKAGLWLQVNKIHQKSVISDGYYTVTPSGRRKMSYIVNTKEVRHALRDFQRQ
jgi:hypothetical protein